MKKLISKAAVLSLSAIVLAACGGGGGGTASSESSAAGSAGSAASSAASSAESTAAADRSEELVIYTNANSDGRGEWLEAKAEEEGFNITLVGAGGADLTNRLISEAANPIADVVYGLNTMFYEQLKENNVVQEYVPTWSDEVMDGINDPEGYYHGLVQQALLLSYNPNVYDESTAPQSYLDLVENEEYAGKYEAPSALDQATPRLILSSILVQFRDDSGELGISQEGWDTVQKFLDNGVMTPAGEDFYSLLASEQVPIGTLVSGTLQAKEDQYGVAAEFVSPEDVGSPAIVESVAIIEGTEQTELAKEFVDWFGSSEVQGQFAAEFNAMPANEVAAEQATDYVKGLYEEITVQELDWGFISEYIDQWMEKIELELL